MEDRWNHKGEYCIYTEKDALLCQEGYCSECEIYRKFKESCESLWGTNCLPIRSLVISNMGISLCCYASRTFYL